MFHYLAYRRMQGYHKSWKYKNISCSTYLAHKNNGFNVESLRKLVPNICTQNLRLTLLKRACGKTGKYSRKRSLAR